MKTAFIILADTQGTGNLGRVVNALKMAKEMHEKGAEVRIIFDGAGTKWVGQLASSKHEYHPLWSQIRSDIAGACSYCSQAFKVEQQVRKAGIALIDEHEGHPSLHKLLTAGFTVLTF